MRSADYRAAALDAGVHSPIVLMLFLTLVYAALSYPRWAVAVVSGASLLAVLILSQVRPGSAAGPTDPVYLAGLLITLAVTGVMCIIQARIQQQARSELQCVSRTDPLTGALNRLGFTERMEAELRRSARDGQQVGLVLLPSTGLAGAEEVAGRLALALSLRIAASVGAAATDRDGSAAEGLHRCADQRLYAAKRVRPAPDPIRAAAG